MIKRKNETGQVALVLVLAAMAAGTLVISLADRSTRDLRTQGLDVERVKALKGAESGVEQALLSGDSVSETSLADGVKFSADYLNEGENGLVSDLLEPGDVFEVLIEGADNGVNKARIYFSSEPGLSALKVSEYRVNGSQYVVNSYAFDGDDSRVLVNKFTDLTEGSGFSFQESRFSNRSSVDINPNTKLLRITVLYTASKVGVEPVGGNLPDQQTTISSVGEYSVSADVRVKKRLELRKEMEKAPSVFDKALYSNSKLIQ